MRGAQEWSLNVAGGGKSASRSNVEPGTTDDHDSRIEEAASRAVAE